MTRAERMVKEADIAHEVLTYNELLGGPGEVGCTLLVELDDPAARAEKLTQWLALPKHLYAKRADGTKAYARYDERQVGETRVSSVQYLTFEVGAAGAGRHRLRPPGPGAAARDDAHRRAAGGPAVGPRVVPGARRRRGPASADEVGRHAPAAVRAPHRRDRLGDEAPALEGALEPDHDVGAAQVAGGALDRRPRLQLAPRATAERRSRRAQGRVPVLRPDFLSQEGRRRAPARGVPAVVDESEPGPARRWSPRAPSRRARRRDDRDRRGSRRRARPPARTAGPRPCPSCSPAPARAGRNANVLNAPTAMGHRPSLM